MLNGQQQEPYEGRSSRTVLWERRGEVPLRDPITPTMAFVVLVEIGNKRFKLESDFSR